MKTLKTFNKLGARNPKGEIIIPSEYDSIDYADGFIAYSDNQLIYKSEEIYICRQKNQFLTRYHVYLNTGVLFFLDIIKDTFVDEDSNLVALKTLDNFWHIVTIDIKGNAIKTLHDDSITKIDSAKYNHVVYRKGFDCFIYSLEQKKIIVGPISCEKITLLKCGFLIQNNNLIGLYDYSGKKILDCKWSEITVLNEKFIRVKEKSLHGLYGLYDFNGQEILPCKNTSLQPKTFQLSNTTYTIFDCTSYNDPLLLSKNLIFIKDNYDIQTLLSYDNIEFFDYSKICLINKNNKSFLYEFTVSNGELNVNLLLSADKIELLTSKPSVYFKVQNNNKFGVSNVYGELLFPISYKDIVYDKVNKKIQAYKNLFKEEYEL